MATADETRQALIDALIRLVRDRSLDSISVREIAGEAGVNHGLVHRYFGSRDKLVEAAAAHVSAEVHSEHAGRGADLFGYLRERPELVRVVAQACLDGQQPLLSAISPDPEHVCEVVEALRKALTGLPVRVDPHVLNGLAISTIFGWLLFRPLLEVGYAVPDDADDQVQQLLALLDVTLGGA